jgi:hypothetical protein
MKRETVVAVAAVSILGVLMILAASAPTAQGQGEPNPAVLARDDFNSGFDLDWQVTRPDFSHWSLSRHPGTLTVTTQDGVFNRPQYTLLKNLFLLGCPAASGEDFETTTCVTLKPVDEFNQAGLVLYNDQANFVSFVYEWGSGVVTGLGNGLRQLTALAMTKGNRTFTSFHIDQDVERIWLRITKRADRYTFSTSLDGKAFIRQDTPFVDPYHAFDGGLRWGDGTVKQVGLFASNSCWENDPPEIETSFDFFEVTAPVEGRKAERPPGSAPRTQVEQLLESLHRAIVAGDLAKVKVVISEGADINAEDAQGATALHWAVKEGNKDIAGLFLGMGASPMAPTKACNWTPLHLAAMEGKDDVVRLLLDKGVPLDGQGFKNRAPFHLAVLGGHAETASLLLQHGGTINVKDGEGKTALHHAVVQRRGDLVKLLLSKGADANAPDDKGRTPSTIAKSKHLGEISDLLSKRGTQPQQEPGKKPSPLLGTWELVSLKYGDQEAFTDFPKNLRRIKMFTETRYIWFQFETDARQLHNAGGGSYTFADDSLTESTDFGLGEMISYLGKEHAFTIRVEGDTLHQSGALSTGLKIQEIWRRVK